MKPEDTDLDSLVEECIRQIEAAAAPPKPELSAVGPFPSVRAHRVLLGQALANLLSNAVKFVSPGVRPRVTVRAERRDGPGGRASVRLWVEDNGIGVAPEHQGRIFRVFERLHPASKYPGTGIGLAIVRRSIERLGGSSGVESEPGRGSRFWIELPAADASRTGRVDS
jgi:signal transduction histidine kinase